MRDQAGLCRALKSATEVGKRVALRSRLLISACFASLFLVVFCIPANATTEAFCDGDWTFKEASLQVARSRIKSPVHKNVANRVECAVRIRDDLQSVDPDHHCQACENEYVQLLRDVITYTRKAAESTSSATSRTKYYLSEITTRRTLGEFLASSSDRSLADKYWSINFEGLGDAMERIGSGREFHDEAIIASYRNVISEKSFTTWARAIRSCQTWNFASGTNRDMPGLRKVLLCVDECKSALAKIRQRVDSNRSVDKDLVKEILGTLLPALDECPTGSSS